jgi:hypothetical protein
MDISAFNCTGIEVGLHTPETRNCISITIWTRNEPIRLSLFDLPSHVTDALCELNALIEAPASVTEAA